MPPGITTSSLCSLDNHTNEWHINSKLYKRIRDQGVYLAHENLAESDPVIIPYKVINSIFTTLYGIITGLLSVKFSGVRYGGSTTHNGVQERERERERVRTGR